MASLTPKEREEEVTSAAMSEGLMTSGMVLLPALGGLYAALQNKSFVKYTNWQSRTALVIMPALFAFTLTSEHKMAHRMEEVAEETHHAIQSVEWADRHHRQKKAQTADAAQKQQELRQLYREAVLNSGVRVIENGEPLGTAHRAANFVQANPFKVIAGVGLPAVAYIFNQRNGKDHLSFQLKILHTRVFGQFAIICTLLGVMGLKEMMDRQGKFITEADVEERVLQMEATRGELMERLDFQAKQQESQKGLSKWKRTTTASSA